MNRCYIHEKKLGRQHPHTLMSINNLGLLYKNQGKYDLAEPLYKECLQAREEKLSRQHTDTLSSINNLASLYDKQGKCDLADLLYEDCIQSAEELLGNEHPHYKIKVTMIL